MSLPLTFCRAFYLSLACSIVCLAYANRIFFGAGMTGYYLVPILALMWLAYHLEGRWSLTYRGANRVGVLLLGIVLVWLLFKLPRSEEELVALGVPWPAGFLPLLGPVLPLLLLGKLFRAKTLADFWPFQIIGLMSVTLGCVLTGEAGFLAPLLAYLASLLLVLSLFYAYRQQVLAGHGSGARADFPLFAPAGAWPSLQGWQLYRRVPLWTLQLLGLGLILFFLAPRFSNEQWIPQKLTSNPRYLFSGGSDHGIDLNLNGQIELSSEVAFEGSAHTSAGAPLPFPGDQRWRAQTLERYHQGRWKSCMSTTSLVGSDPVPVQLGRQSSAPMSPRIPPDDLAPGQSYLTFQVKIQQAGSLVLAHPIRPELHPGRQPTLNNDPLPRCLFEYFREFDLLRPTVFSRRPLFSYGQVFDPNDSTDYGPAQDLRSDYRDSILEQPVPQIGPFTRDLLLDLPNLTDDQIRTDKHKYLHRTHHETIARALTKYLNSSGHFTYTLKLRRKDHKVDPLADFLLNLREGHCERYAGALALMLRSLGIPARIVRGYAGVESQDAGAFLVRQHHAHAWVEALVPGDAPGAERWLTLDPTPSTDLVGRSLAGWMAWAWNSVQFRDYLWRTYFMELDTDTQLEAARSAWTNARRTQRQKTFWATVGDVLMLGLGLGTVYGLGRWAYRRRQQLLSRPLGTPALFPFYERYLMILAGRCGLRPGPGQTPLEFAQATRLFLNTLPPALEDRDLPLDLVDALYRHRFGAQPFAPIWSARLDNFEKALSSLTPLAV